LPAKYQRRYWILQEIYRQQQQMYDNKSRRCDDRIVSISQPHIRPIVRGKSGKKVEFGPKLGVGLARWFCFGR
jgi:transposase, IS5 family